MIVKASSSSIHQGTTSSGDVCIWWWYGRGWRRQWGGEEEWCHVEWYANYVCMKTNFKPICKTHNWIHGSVHIPPHDSIRILLGQVSESK